MSIKGTIGPVGIIPRFVDWDGDGDIDLVITGTDKVQLFQRGICQPSSSYCKSGVCNQRTSACTCDSFAGGQDCSLCGNFYVRENGKCRPCPGHNELAGTCSRRGEGGLRKRPEESKSIFLATMIIAYHRVILKVNYHECTFVFMYLLVFACLARCL